LLVVERPCHVVVAPAPERTHAVEVVGLGTAEDDHGRLAAPAVDLGLVRREHEIRSRAVVTDELEPVAAQVTLEERPGGLLSLREEQRGRHAARLASPPAREQMSFAATLRRRILSRPRGPRLEAARREIS